MSRQKVSSPISSRFSILRDQNIGAGGYGTVYLAVDHILGMNAAVKESNIGASNAKLEKSLRDEYELLTRLSHPNIVKVFQLSIDSGTGCAQVFMEWMALGSVHGVITGNKFRLHEHAIRRYIGEILKGLAYLHHQGLVHRDIKPANMLVGGGGEIKLSDFGTCKLIENDETQTASGVSGTVLYLAPECVIKNKYSTASDIWSVGCSIIEMSTGLHPWSELPLESRSGMALMFHIGTAQPPNHHPKIPSHISPALQEIVEACFDMDPMKRPTAEALVSHPYFTSADPPAGCEDLQEFKTAWEGASTVNSEPTKDHSFKWLSLASCATMPTGVLPDSLLQVGIPSSVDQVQKIRLAAVGDSLTAGMVSMQTAFVPEHPAFFPYTDIIAAAAPRFEVSNFGVSGEGAKQIKNRLWSILSLGAKDDFRDTGDENTEPATTRQVQQHPLSSPFDYIVILAGTNDLGTGADPRRVALQIREMCNIIISSFADRCVPVIVTIPALGSRWVPWLKDDGPVCHRLVLNNEIRKTAQELDIPCVDLFQATSEEHSESNECQHIRACRYDHQPERKFMFLKQEYDGDGLHMSKKGYEVFAQLVMDAVLKHVHGETCLEKVVWREAREISGIIAEKQKEEKEAQSELLQKKLEEKHRQNLERKLKK